jgi:hypothetical protein
VTNASHAPEETVAREEMEVLSWFPLSEHDDLWENKGLHVDLDARERKGG